MKTYEECRFAILKAAESGCVNDIERNRKILNCEYKTLGIKVPVIKDMAKSVSLEYRDAILNGFFADTDVMFETVLFAGCLISRKGDYAKTREYLKRIIPMFGSWAHTDTIVPLLRWVDVDAFLNDFKYLLNSDGQYMKRFYIIFLMARCLTDDRIDFVLDTVKSIDCGDYYVGMAVAWLVSVAVVKQYDKVLPLLVSRTLPPDVHNKAIQKARESFRVGDDVKAYLSTLKIQRA